MHINKNLVIFQLYAKIYCLAFFTLSATAVYCQVKTLCSLCIFSINSATVVASRIVVSAKLLSLLDYVVMAFIQELNVPHLSNKSKPLRAEIMSRSFTLAVSVTIETPFFRVYCLELRKQIIDFISTKIPENYSQRFFYKSTK